MSRKPFNFLDETTVFRIMKSSLFSVEPFVTLYAINQGNAFSNSFMTGM